MPAGVATAARRRRRHRLSRNVPICTARADLVLGRLHRASHDPGSRKKPAGDAFTPAAATATAVVATAGSLPFNYTSVALTAPSQAAATNNQTVRVLNIAAGSAPSSQSSVCQPVCQPAHQPETAGQPGSQTARQTPLQLSRWAGYGFGRAAEPSSRAALQATSAFGRRASRKYGH